MQLVPLVLLVPLDELVPLVSLVRKVELVILDSQDPLEGQVQLEQLDKEDKMDLLEVLVLQVLQVAQVPQVLLEQEDLQVKSRPYVYSNVFYMYYYFIVINKYLI